MIIGRITTKDTNDMKGREKNSTTTLLQGIWPDFIA
jgi:hypothetical protein